ncbi:soluble NSF attachment protein receptor [Tribonema minus]|uniref:Soluble NSF attachment protein receptor n=1 Tax=Tribonema minus TaxID=303371 RepID=A0A835YY22_9STRA|nr:soluble NSF attachment protein receptor [Tribonema minus]
MPAGMDRELDVLLMKLQKILLSVGGDDLESGGKKKSSKDDRFNLVKASVMRRLTETCELMEKAAATSGGGLASSTADPKAVIKRNQDIRSNLRTLEAEWGEMDVMFQAERTKRRSKMTKEEMEARRQLLVDLQREIAELKALNQQAAVGASVGVASSAYAAFKPQDSAAALAGGAKGGAEVRPANLSNEQHYRIQQIRERSKEMENTYLSKIEEHVDRLGDLARGMGEELVLQERMLDDLGNRIESTQEKLANVNVRMKDTLKKVRAADKFCVDIMCVLLMLGLAAVLYAVIKNG